jgi:beta-glucosidase
VIRSGTNLEMPHADYLNEPAVAELLAGGQISEAEIDRMVRGTLASFFRFGFYDREQADPDALGFGGWHDEVSLETARKGMVLLRNEDRFLPLDPDARSTVVLLGVNTRETESGGYGAARVEPTDPVSILDSVRGAAGPGVEVLQFDEATPEAVAAMRSADAVFVSFSTREREANDRDFELPGGTLALIKSATDASDRVGVVVTAGSGVDLSPFVADTRAVLFAFFGGNVGTTAVGEILFGRTNPSGKLPFTIERSWDESPAYGRFLPEDASFNDEPIWGRERAIFDVVYDEGVYSGYRHFHGSDAEPLFPFGHGLSYTSFSLSGLSLSGLEMGAESDGSVEASVRVENLGDRAGAEVVQVYTETDIGAGRPPLLQLAGFRRLELAPGESRVVSLRVGLPASGTVRRILAGNSSGDLPLSAPFADDR